MYYYDNFMMHISVFHSQRKSEASRAVKDIFRNVFNSTCCGQYWVKLEKIRNSTHRCSKFLHFVPHLRLHFRLNRLVRLFSSITIKNCVCVENCITKGDMYKNISIPKSGIFHLC